MHGWTQGQHIAMIEAREREREGGRTMRPFVFSVSAHTHSEDTKHRWEENQREI